MPLVLQTSRFVVLGLCLKRGILPNVVTINALLNRLVREHRIVKAEILFKKLVREKLCEPNVVAFARLRITLLPLLLLRLMDMKGVARLMLLHIASLTVFATTN